MDDIFCLEGDKLGARIVCMALIWTGCCNHQCGWEITNKDVQKTNAYTAMYQLKLKSPKHHFDRGTTRVDSQGTCYI